MAVVTPTIDLYTALQEEDFPLPAECIDVDIHIPPDGLMEIKYRCFVPPEHLEMISRALLRVAVAARQRKP